MFGLNPDPTHRKHQIQPCEKKKKSQIRIRNPGNLIMKEFGWRDVFLMYNINNNQEVEPGALGPPKPENGFLHFFLFFLFQSFFSFLSHSLSNCFVYSLSYSRVTHYPSVSVSVSVSLSVSVSVSVSISRSCSCLYFPRIDSLSR